MGKADRRIMVGLLVKDPASKYKLISINVLLMPSHYVKSSPGLQSAQQKLAFTNLPKLALN